MASDWSGLDFARERFEELQRLDYASWRREVLEHEELFVDLQIIFRNNSCASESFLFVG